MTPPCENPASTMRRVSMPARDLLVDQLFDRGGRRADVGFAGERRARIDVVPRAHLAPPLIVDRHASVRAETRSARMWRPAVAAPARSARNRGRPRRDRAARSPRRSAPVRCDFDALERHRDGLRAWSCKFISGAARMQFSSIDGSAAMAIGEHRSSAGANNAIMRRPINQRVTHAWTSSKIARRVVSSASLDRGAAISRAVSVVRRRRVARVGRHRVRHAVDRSGRADRDRCRIHQRCARDARQSLEVFALSRRRC